MAAITIKFEVDSDRLDSFSDDYLAQLWHIGQANPAPFGDAAACEFAEHVGREIVRRWLAKMEPVLWMHQADHVAAAERLRALAMQRSQDSADMCTTTNERI